MKAAALWLLAGAAAASAAGPDRGPYLVDAASSSAVVCARHEGRDSCHESPDPTLRLPGPAQPVTFAAFGDSGSGSQAQAEVARQLEKGDPQLVLLLGDVVYEHGEDEHYDDRFFPFYAKLIARRPFFPAVGNHDYANAWSASRGRSRFESGYKRVFHRPPYYSFDAGPVHFVSLDTNQAYRIGAAAPAGADSAQVAWLEKDLAASRAPWKVVFMHVPLFGSRPHGDYELLRASLEPVLERFHVDLALAGHDHTYERWKPINGVTYVIAGTGGAKLNDYHPAEPRLARKLTAHGFVFARADAKVLRLQFIDHEGHVEDAAELRK